jgi:O-antigen ligase
MRALAAAAAALLGAGVYLSFSRGAIAVAVLGVLVLLALVPTRAQLRAATIALAAGIAAAACAAASPAVSALEGTTGDRSREGAIVLVLLVFAAGGAAAATLHASRRADGQERPQWAHHARPVAIGAVCVAVLGLLIGSLGERPSREELARGAAAGRLGSVSSNRYEYWRVGLDSFARKPLTGVGAGGFRVDWLRERTFREAVKDTHSLEIEMAAELGLVGLLALALFIAGVAAAARTALRRHPTAAAGPAAATLAFFLHASIDWDWQLPAVTLPAIVLAGALVALSEDGR